MTHVITRSCCNDAACTRVCPTNCIHPTPDEPDFGSAEMLYIDPRNCIDCGACVEVCPVSAIQPDHRLSPAQAPYLALNSEYFIDHTYDQPGFRESVSAEAPLVGVTIAVVGSGPAAIYAVEEALAHLDATSEVHVFERLPVPWGLVRHGVAPDHQDTKQVAHGFERTADDPRVHFHLNVEVGTDLTHQELIAHFHAVVYGVGAQAPRRLGIPGEDLPGSLTAADVVSWYNGHPDGKPPELGHGSGRAVVIGNGNVALDVARILATRGENPDSDISQPALEVIRDLNLAEVVVLGRRGPAHAAFTTPELLALSSLPDVEVVLDSAADLTGLSGVRRAAFEALPRVTAGSRGRPGSTTITLRFDTTPVEVVGSAQVAGLRTTPTGHDGRHDVITCSLVVAAVGYEVAGIDGVPLTDAGHAQHEEGRVDDGVYVVGWAKRGPSGVIGTNKACAAETVATMVADLRSGRASTAVHPPDAAVEQLESRRDLADWRRLDRHEIEAGRASGRPRLKIVDRSGMLSIMAR